MAFGCLLVYYLIAFMITQPVSTKYEESFHMASMREEIIESIILSSPKVCHRLFPRSCYATRWFTFNRALL
jgi:hypothetical protein